MNNMENNHSVLERTNHFDKSGEFTCENITTRRFIICKGNGPSFAVNNKRFSRTQKYDNGSFPNASRPDY